ncbi:FAD-dependent oxidoreductase [Maioricimonas sp. JC845]|uniref:FAD-dependent oxidoreductase n=1 Tax=Maioricimonas sp. JC845 TaxID=3232138 RepID=UPI003458BC97
MNPPFDVIVAGGGGSGLAAALSAAESGARVLLLEKNPRLGGTTGIAIGSFTGNRTALQQSAGINDDPAEHNHDAGLFAPASIEARNNDAMRQFFLEQTADTFDWLNQLGLRFYGPSPEPPNRVPRMHNVVPNAKAYIATLQAALLRRGGTIWCNATVQDLIVENGSVTGVHVMRDGSTQSVKATRGVILATGDYANSPEMIARFKGKDFADVEGINTTATGDGHLLAEQAGAELVNMDVTYGPEIRFVPPPRNNITQLLPASGPLARLMGALMPLVPQFLVNSLIRRLLVTWQHPEDSLFADGAILVNAHGERFCNELDSPAREIAIAQQPDKQAYLLLDARLAALYSDWPKFISTAPKIAYAYVDDYLRLRPDVACSGATPAHVARQRGLPADALQQTVDDFNQSARQGQPDQWGRTTDSPALTGDRWVLLGPARAYFTTTEGGAMVNPQMQVLTSAGEPIPGLFAVGQVGLAGMILWGHGLHIAWALTSGRIAGHAVMASQSE